MNGWRTRSGWCRILLQLPGGVRLQPDQETPLNGDSPKPFRGMRDRSGGRRLCAWIPEHTPKPSTPGSSSASTPWIAITSGVLVYLWPPLYRWPAVPFDLGPYGRSDPRTWGAFALLRVVAATVVAFGCCAFAFAVVDNPLGRRRALIGLCRRALRLRRDVLHPVASDSFVLAPAGRRPRPFRRRHGAALSRNHCSRQRHGPSVPAAARPRQERARISPFEINGRRSRGCARSTEEQIRQAARQEERARLARDLHDAVKQQFFVIQTAAATAQARFETDPDGAKTAVDQVRSSAREAMTEMEAMLEQLQAAPLENAGLVSLAEKAMRGAGVPHRRRSHVRGGHASRRTPRSSLGRAKRSSAWRRSRSPTSPVTPGPVASACRSGRAAAALS